MLNKLLYTFMLSVFLLTIHNGCSSSGSSNGSSQNSSNQSEINTVFSETEYMAGIVHSLVSERSIYFELEAIDGSTTLTDTDTLGEDEFAITIDEDIQVNTCVLTDNPSYTLQLLDENGTVLLSQTSTEDAIECNKQSNTSITLSAGSYTVSISQNSPNNRNQFMVLKLEPVTASTSISTRSSIENSNNYSTSVPSFRLSAAPPQPYDFTQSYQANTVVTYKGSTYVNGWWANPGQCPVQSDCSSAFAAGLWKIYDPSVKHEFAYYNYPALQASYPSIPDCTESDYSLSNIQSIINTSIASGEISRAAPSGGFNQADKDALYREYMLPCNPNLTSYTPSNVTLVQSILTPEVWDALASKIYTGDLGLSYLDADGNSVPWPAEANYKAEAYNNFLTAIARYPYFCGEQGYFDSIEEACKRELSSLFAHASQETGNTDVTQSFYWLREYGYVNGGDNSYFKTGCARPFDCTTNGWARYYGRGPKQLTYYYNYAGFSAAYFNGNYNFLLLWPDLVAYDGKMYFETAIFYVMTQQPPKPSIHDILLGRYQPTSCVSDSDCAGLQYDATSGVQNNFDITIEAVNGGVECRTDSEEGFKQAARNRSQNYLAMLSRVGATLTAAESSLPLGCAFINATKAELNTVFSQEAAQAGLRTWLDMSGTSCQAQSLGGNSMISVTATGIVDACINR